MTETARAGVAADLVRDAVARRIFPAAAAEVGASTGSIWTEAFGTLTFDTGAASTECSTVFDLASLTKPIATSTVVLDLVREGRLSLTDQVSGHFPEWIGQDRAPATIRLLLEHAAGLSARLLDSPPSDRRGFEHEICVMPLEYPPGSRSIYTDLGFILLGFCAERLAGVTLGAQTARLLDPIVSRAADREDAVLLTQVSGDMRDRVAPTLPLDEDWRRGRRLIGEVHDNYAAALGGFAGHAGLFGTATGVGAFARATLRAARGDESAGHPLTPAVVNRMIQRGEVPGSSRALGWDTMRVTSSCGTRMSARAFGHVGFTGTSLWIDPVRDRYFVLLTNRVCEGGTSDQMQQLRRAFHDALGDI
jgi:CubicO group peptidase (beta-lactamase class C family)